MAPLPAGHCSPASRPTPHAPRLHAHHAPRPTSMPRLTPTPRSTPHAQPVERYLPPSEFTCLAKSEKRGVQAARNGPSEGGKCWQAQRFELGIHGLNRWLVKC